MAVFEGRQIVAPQSVEYIPNLEHSLTYHYQKLDLRSTSIYCSTSSGDRVKLACVNWSGGQLKAYVVNGLDVQPLKSIAQTIADLGFNCVRLVNSLDLIYLNPVSCSVAK